MGLRGPARRLGRRARALGDHLHRVRAGRARASSSRRPRTSTPSSATASIRHPGGQERGAAAAPDRRPLGPPPPSEDGVRRRPRRDPPLPLRRTSSAGARPSRCSSRATAPGGTRCGSASARRRSRPSTAGCSSTTASRRPSSGDIYRVGLALLDLDEPTRVLRRLPSLGPRAARRLRANAATFRTSCSRAASSTTTRATRSASTTAPPTARSASPPRDSADLIDAVLAAPGRGVGDREDQSPTALFPIPAVETRQLRPRVETGTRPGRCRSTRRRSAALQRSAPANAATAATAGFGEPSARQSPNVRSWGARSSGGLVPQRRVVVGVAPEHRAETAGARSASSAVAVYAAAAVLFDERAGVSAGSPRGRSEGRTR